MYHMHTFGALGASKCIHVVNSVGFRILLVLGRHNLVLDNFEGYQMGKCSQNLPRRRMNLGEERMKPCNTIVKPRDSYSKLN